MQEPSVVIYKMAETIKKLEEQLKEAERDRDALANSIRSSSMKAGILAPGHSLSVPQLSMLAKDLGLSSHAFFSAMPDAKRYQHVKKFLSIEVVGSEMHFEMPPTYALVFDYRGLMTSVPGVVSYTATVDELIDRAIEASENENKKAV